MELYTVKHITFTIIKTHTLAHITKADTWVPLCMYNIPLRPIQRRWTQLIPYTVQPVRESYVQVYKYDGIFQSPCIDTHSRLSPFQGYIRQHMTKLTRTVTGPGKT